MLPLEGVFFIPSLFVTPLAVAVILWARQWPSYPRLWRTASIVCVVLTGLFLALALGTPFYSERDHSPDNPGGPSGSIFGVIVILVVQTCIVLPAFPVLVALACLPPHGWNTRLAVGVLLYVGILTGLIAWKNAAYMADYRLEKAKPRQNTLQRFQHLRTNPGAE